ncbi:hypothetical protein SAMN05443661_101229 [Natronobacterium gregoryi]|uniref:Uncharacterized protein n=1 Tax=Natronobacterium gregoryi TaxID=44930 RepID=A0A1I3J195_9EURY|nr:hypothetical protein SAMN05443661_101229 [Natronobacterium gregoryi]
MSNRVVRSLSPLTISPRTRPQSVLSLNSERIPPFTAGVNRITRLLNPPSPTGLKPQRLVRTASYVFARFTSAFGTCAEVRDALKPTSWVFRGEGSHGRMDHGSSDAGFASFVSTGTRSTGRGSVIEPTVPRGMTAWERDALRNRASMTRLRMGAHVTVPQDAPERGTNPVPPTSGEAVLKPARQQAGFPRAGEAPSFTTGRMSPLPPRVRRSTTRTRSRTRRAPLSAVRRKRGRRASLPASCGRSRSGRSVGTSRSAAESESLVTHGWPTSEKSASCHSSPRRWRRLWRVNCGRARIARTRRNDR